MKRKLLCFLLVFLLVVLNSCSKTQNQESVTQKPQRRTAVLFSSYAQIWKAVGGNIEITVGDSVKRGFAEQDVVLVNPGAGLKIDTEALIAAQPDLVITTTDLAAQVKAAKLCKDLGIETLELHEETFEDYLEILKLFADLNNNKTAYKELGLDVGARIEKIKALPQPKDVSYLFIRAGSAFSSTKARRASNHFACKIFDDLGAHNIADDLNGITDTLSIESILVEQPDIIVVVPQGNEADAVNYIETLFKTPGWADLNAVKENKVYFVSKELFNFKPNMYWDVAYQTAYEILYGEVKK